MTVFSTSPPNVPSRRRGSASRGGFTLIELIVVLFCMVIAAAIAIPRYASFQRASMMRDTARNVAAMVRKARIAAIEQQRPVVLSVDPQSHSVTLRFDDTILPIDNTSTTTSTNGSMSGSGGGSASTVAGGDESIASQPLIYPEKMEVTLQVEDTASQGSASSGDFTFMPDGRAPDADIVVATDSSHGMQIAVRRQATRIQIALAGANDMPFQGGR